MPRALYALPPLLVVFTDSMSVAILAPVLAPMVQHPPAGGLMNDLSATTRNLLYGVALGLQPLLTIYFAPLLGQLSDKLGRKRILLFTMVGLTLANVGIGLAVSSGMVLFLLLGRAVKGVLAGNQPVAQATMVDVSPPGKKTLYLSIALLASSLGFLVGPLLGALLADPNIVSWFQPDLPFYFLAALSALTVVLIVYLSPTATPGTPAPSEVGRIDFGAGFRFLIDAFREPATRTITIVFFLMQMGWASYFLFLPTFLVAVEGFSRAQIGAFMAIMGAGFCVSGVGLPYLTRLWSPSAIARTGLLLTVVGIVGTTLAGSGPWQWLVLGPTGFVQAVAYGSIILLYSEAVDSTKQGRILGISIAVVNLAWGLVSIVAGYLAATGAWAPMGLAVLLTSLSWLASLALRQPSPPPVSLQAEPIDP